MTDNVSDTSSLDELPVYFHIFTRESLAAIRQRMTEEEIAKKLELPKPEVIVVFSYVGIKSNYFPNKTFGVNFKFLITRRL